jgi:RHS repeat-associated protein
VTDAAYLYDGWNLVAETISDPQSTHTNFYIWGADRDGSLDSDSGGVGGLLAIIRDTTVYYPVMNHHGDVMALIDDSGSNIVARYEYDPWGVLLSATGPAADACPFRWQTKYIDAETGLYYFGYRFFDSLTGRWLSRDPLQEEGGVNLYAFCGNDPVNGVDPLGLESENSESRTFTKEDVPRYLRPWYEEFEQWRTIPKVLPGGSEQLKQGLFALKDFELRLIFAHYYSRYGLYPDPVTERMLEPLLSIASEKVKDWELAYRGASSVEQGMVCNLENNITDPNCLSILSMALSMGIKSSFTFKTPYNLSKPGRVGPAAAENALYWHGSPAGVAARNEGGLFVNGRPGAGRKFWVTTRKLEETGPGQILLGGNINVWPNPGLKGGFSATYKLSSEEAALFHKASGFEFSWNPIEWWKGAAGQYYYRPGPVSLGQRLGEASIPVVGTGAGVGTLIYLNNQ